MNKEVAAYIAGIVDGEGSMWLDRFKTKKSKGKLKRSSFPYQYRIVVCVTMCDKPTIDFIAKHTGRVVRKRMLPKKHSKGFRRRLIAYEIVWRNGFAGRFLHQIFPYLICKRPKAELCIMFQDEIAPGRGRTFDRKRLSEYEAIRKKISAS